MNQRALELGACRGGSSGTSLGALSVQILTVKNVAVSSALQPIRIQIQGGHFTTGHRIQRSMAQANREGHSGLGVPEAQAPAPLNSTIFEQ